MTEREQIPMDVVFVGAGPANLAAALHLKNEIKKHNDLVNRGLKHAALIGDLEIAIVEKGSFVGAHILSGAVMDPIVIRELMPDFIAEGCPVDAVVTEDAEIFAGLEREADACQDGNAAIGGVQVLDDEHQAATFLPR